MIIACFIVIFALTRFGQKWLKHGKIIRSNFDTQPLVTITPSKFDAETGSTLTQCSTNHPLIGKSTLYGNNFADSQGFVVKFNTEGVSDFKDSSELACLFPFFDAVRDPAANAFVLNVLHVDPDTNDHPIRWHLDQTVGIYSTNMYTAHTVSVWYARVPPKMSGGELEISAYNTSSFGGGGRPEDVVKECSPEWTRSGAPNKDASSSLERNPGAETGGAEAEYGDPADFEGVACFRQLDAAKAYTSPALPAAEAESSAGGGAVAADGASAGDLRVRVVPRENALVAFRGDAFHRVAPYSSADGSASASPSGVAGGGSRVSLVLEQYIIKRSHFWKTIRFRLIPGG